MGWNYRVMRHPPDPARGEPAEWYAVYEVFYWADSVDDQAVGSSEVGYTAVPIAAVADDVGELR